MFERNKYTDEYSDKTPLLKAEKDEERRKKEEEERKKQSKSSTETKSFYDWMKKPNKYEPMKDK